MLSRTSGQELKLLEEIPRCPGLCSYSSLCMLGLYDGEEELGKKNQTTKVSFNVTNSVPASHSASEGPGEVRVG